MTEPTRYAGGCHCGVVRFTVAVAERVAHDCNCSICRMRGHLHVIVPRDRFELLRGEAELREYRFGTGTARHLFCGTCGICSYYVPRSHPDGYSVNLRCLDGDAMADFAIVPFDGANWERAIDQIR